MRRIVPIFLMALLISVSAKAQVDPAAPKEAVTIEINQDLLRRARELNVDLSAFIEERLATALKMESNAPAMSHKALVTAAFDSLESMMFAPLQIDASTPTDSVRATCQSMVDDLNKLVGYADTRKSMAAPATLEEAKALDDYLAGRFQALQTRMGEVGGQIQGSIAIIQRDCPDMDQDDAVMQEAMATALGQYGPSGWCNAMRQKPQAEWTMDDGTNYAKFCTGGN